MNTEEWPGWFIQGIWQLLPSVLPISWPRIFIHFGFLLSTLWIPYQVPVNEGSKWNKNWTKPTFAAEAPVRFMTQFYQRFNYQVNHICTKDLPAFITWGYFTSCIPHRRLIPDLRVPYPSQELSLSLSAVTIDVSNKMLKSLNIPTWRKDCSLKDTCAQISLGNNTLVSTSVQEWRVCRGTMDV